MAHFAQVDENNIVIQVIVADQEFIDILTAMENPPVDEEEDAVEEKKKPVKRWIQTSYNTRHGVHSKGGTPLRANYAGVGYIYDEENDVFYEPKPAKNPSFILTGAPEWKWTFPIPKPKIKLPEGERHIWDEESTSWIVWRPEPEVPEEEEAPKEGL